MSDVPVCSVGVWHKAHPMALNMCLPLAIDDLPPGVSAEGVGGASNRMNMEKPMASPAASTVLVACTLEVSSGVGFSLQLSGSFASSGLGRSLGNSSLVTPISTL